MKTILAVLLCAIVAVAVAGFVFFGDSDNEIPAETTTAQQADLNVTDGGPRKNRRLRICIRRL